MPVSSPRRAGAVSLVLLLLPLAACTNADDDAARETADDLTAALSQHTLDGAALTEPTAAAAFEEQIAPLTGYDVEVAADDVERDGDTGTVVLHWTWTVEGDEWTYDTTAHLVEGEERWEVEWGPSTFVPELTADDRIEVQREFGPRADVVGTDGEPIVTERSVGRYGLDKAVIDPDEVGASAERIATAVGLDPEAFRTTAENAGPQAFVEAIVIREGEEEQHVSADFAGIPGALVVEDELPLAPTRDFARELLGYVGEATSEAVEASDGAVRPGDQVGLAGLLATYDSTLRGTPGIAIEAVDAADARRTLAEWDGVEGQPLVLTLDQGIQSSAEEILAGLGGEEAPGSAIVAVRPSTGEVLAAANGEGNAGHNVATTGAYAPGSTFKLVTALALLRAGVALDDIVSCPPSLEVDGFTFQNDDDYPDSAVGDITFETAIAHSCNTALIGLRDRIDEGALETAAESLGLGAEVDLGYPASLGQVPEPEGETEKAADLIGQGRVLATPLAMATVAASIQAGQTVVPHLLADRVGEADPAQPLTEDEAAALQSLMRSVVTEGSATFLGAIPGVPVGAKTGTAEYGEPDDNGDYATHSWMVGTHGDLAVAVFVEDGVSGAETAGPLLASLFERW
ncbi:penicillin-binding transpeptidase domain-containing protein [Microbacterium betulae]|uniref:Beta-lactamase n=1 Tax=Microbacterium betulae TaxID=2981139 RepID=A0AA97FJV6_9MICO|nr:penicillin-binding transpeptidase domain-containing protein [Microbacterium sp. AB]WOF24400.1 penicillin-binding transpeptidase domain-containing protein [Microbacterium sp. AB]